MLPLDGLRVLDLSRLLPGPYCTLLLAELGADVVKVEDPRGGDWLRAAPPQRGDSSALFQALNRNKRSLALDIKTARGRALLLELVRRYDVVVESFRPGVLAALGLGYAALSEANARVVLCSISGFGQRGLLSGRAGHDLGYVARAGVLSPSRAQTPAPLPVPVADYGGALAAAVAVLAAVRQRDRTGRGQHLDVSLFASALGFLHVPFGARLLLGREAAGAWEPDFFSGNLPCYRLYRTADHRFLAVAALEPKFWQAFCQAIQRPDLEGLGWATGEEGAFAIREVAREVAARTLEQWEAFLEDKDLCCEPVRDGEEALEELFLMDPSAFLNIVDSQRGGVAPQMRVPVRIGEPPARPAPRLGEHSEEVLAECGFSPQRIEALRRAGVVG